MIAQLTECPMCRIKLTMINVARRDDGEIRKDAAGRPWCTSCTEKHDSIDFDKE